MQKNDQKLLTVKELPQLLEAGTDEIWMTTKDVARYLKVSCSFLEKIRWRGAGPTYHKPRGGKVLYKKSDVDRWMETQRC